MNKKWEYYDINTKEVEEIKNKCVMTEKGGYNNGNDERVFSRRTF